MPFLSDALRLSIAASLFTAGSALAEEPAAKPALTVFTYDSFVAEWGPGPKIEAGFEATCGCDLQWVGLGDGVAILNRLKLEGAGTKADIALGLTAELVPEAKASGFFAPSGTDLSKLTVPGGFADDTFVPFDYSYLAFVYDTETVKTPPTSLDELVNGDPEQKIVIEDPRSSTPGLGFLLWMKAIYGEKAAEKWAVLSKRILTVTPGWSEAYGLFTSGETPIVLSYTTSPAYHILEEKTERYQAASFSEGHYLQLELAGRIATSKQPKLGADFLAYLVSPAVQAILPTTNWALPVTEPATPLPDVFARMVQPVKPLAIPADEVVANRKAWTEEWRAALGR